MHMWTSRPSSRTNFRDWLAARDPIAHLNKVLIIVCVQHLAAIFSLDDDRVAIPVFNSTLDDSSPVDSMNRGPGRGSDIGSRMVFRLAVDGVLAPAARGGDDAVDRKLGVFNWHRVHFQWSMFHLGTQHGL